MLGDFVYVLITYMKSCCFTHFSQGHRVLFAVLLKHTGRTTQALEMGTTLAAAPSSPFDLLRDSPIASLFQLSAEIRRKVGTVGGGADLNVYDVRDVDTFVERLRVRARFLLSLETSSVDVFGNLNDVASPEVRHTLTVVLKISRFRLLFK